MFFSFQDLSPELAAMLLAAVIGGYTLIGGLGATFYVSYFNTALIFVLIVSFIANRQIGGYTGDVLGATQQVSEIVILITVGAFAL